jgi:hypothetical protein
MCMRPLTKGGTLENAARYVPVHVSKRCDPMSIGAALSANYSLIRARCARRLG